MKKVVGQQLMAVNRLGLDFEVLRQEKIRGNNPTLFVLKSTKPKYSLASLFEAFVEVERISEPMVFAKPTWDQSFAPLRI